MIYLQCCYNMFVFDLLACVMLQIAIVTHLKLIFKHCFEYFIYSGAVSLGILLETVPKAVALAVLVAAAAAAPRLDATAATNWATLPRLAPWSHER